MKEKTIISTPSLKALPKDLTPEIVRHLTIESAQQLACVSREWRNYLQTLYFLRFQHDYPRRYRNLYAQIPGFSSWIEAYALARREDEEAFKKQDERHLFCLIRDKDEEALIDELENAEMNAYALTRRMSVITAVEKITLLHLARRNGLRQFLEVFYRRLQFTDASDVRDNMTWAITSFQPQEEIERIFIRLEKEYGLEDACFIVAQKACDAGNIEVLRYIIEERKSDFNTVLLPPTEEPWLMLLWGACNFGYADIVRYLFENTPLNIQWGFLRGRDQRSALECACRSGDTEIIRLLVEQGCRFTTPMYLDLLLHSESLEALRYVVEKTSHGKALVDELLNVEATAAHLWFWFVCETHHVAIVEYLIPYFNIHRTLDGESTLDNFCARFSTQSNCTVNDIRVAKTLLRHGFEFKQYQEQRVIEGVTVLIRGRHELTRLMLEGYIRSLGARHPFIKRAATVLLKIFSSENPTPEQFHEVERFVKPFAQREEHMLTVFYVEFMRQVLPNATIEQQFEVNCLQMYK